MTAESLMAPLPPDTSFSSSFLTSEEWAGFFNSFVRGHFWGGGEKRKKEGAFQLAGKSGFYVTTCQPEFSVSHLLDGYLCRLCSLVSCH